jgi:putative ABC transport system permease protein
VAPVVGSKVTLVAGAQNWQSHGQRHDQRLLHRRQLEARRRPVCSSDDEERAGKAVCVIGNTVKNAALPQRLAARRRYPRQELRLRVIGLLAAKGQGAMGQDQDDVVLMPIRTAQRRLTGTPTYRPRIHALAARTASTRRRSWTAIEACSCANAASWRRTPTTTST